MTYAVMQTGLMPPSAEQLKNAFQQVPGLAPMDVNVLGKDACGVLIKGFELERASIMQSALAAQGVETKIVEDAVLPELPPPRQLAKVEFAPDGLLTDDLVNRKILLEWNNILLIAAGRARLTDFTREVISKPMKRSGRDGNAGPKLLINTVTREEQKDHLLLEIIMRGNASRYHVKADRPEAWLLFGCLGERRSRNPAANLSLFVRDMAKHAPSALLNQGALDMRENVNASLCYPSQTAFYREITWLLWMAASGRARGWFTTSND